MRLNARTQRASLRQVFIIAAREFLDFGVFLLFILVLLGSAVFAFFQLTGGNYQFLRFADGLSVMSRLTFGARRAVCAGLMRGRMRRPGVRLPRPANGQPVAAASPAAP